MKEFDYYIDERSETIEKLSLDKNANMAKILDIDLDNLVE